VLPRPERTWKVCGYLSGLARQTRSGIFTVERGNGQIHSFFTLEFHWLLRYRKKHVKHKVLLLTNLVSYQVSYIEARETLRMAITEYYKVPKTS
jgi:hypothetical protein